MNAAECLLSAGADAAVALECGDRRVTYAELRAAVPRAGGAWRALGLEPGARVVIFAPDSDDWVIAYLGAIWAGGVVIGVNPHLALSDLAPILTDSEVRFIWCEPDLAKPVAALAQSLPDGPTVVVPGDGGSRNWTVAMHAASPIDASEQGDDAPALWIGTSGTTGIPKGVIHAAARRRPRPRIRRAGAGGDRRGPVLLDLEAVFRVRARQQPVRRLSHRRHGHPRPRAGNAPAHARNGRSASAHAPLHRADALQQDAAGACRAGSCRRRDPPFRLGGRSAAGHGSQRLAPGDRQGADLGIRDVGNAVPRALLRRRFGAAAADAAHARALRRRHRSRHSATHFRSPANACPRVLETSRGAGRRLSRWLVFTGRHVHSPRRPAGIRRPHGRSAQSLRTMGEHALDRARAGGGGRRRDRPGRRRGSGNGGRPDDHRRAGRGRSRARGSGPRSHRRRHRETAQIPAPALGALGDRTAADRDRQAAAQPPARRARVRAVRRAQG